MRTWTTQTTVTGLPDEVLALLTEPDAIARWTPVPFELLELDTDHLVSGTRARVRGRLAGRSLEFDVEVLAADDERLALRPPARSRSTSTTACARLRAEATYVPRCR
jgi:hypothetical protein